MPNVPTHTSITVKKTTKQKIQDIRKMKHMLTEDGLQRSTPIVMDEVVDFYLAHHQKDES